MGKKIIKRIGASLITLWLFGVFYRIFFEKTSGGGLVQQVKYTYLDAFIDGSLIAGIIFLIISAFIRKKETSVSDVKKTTMNEG